VTAPQSLVIQLVKLIFELGKAVKIARNTQAALGNPSGMVRRERFCHANFAT
jgi:succinylglutamate desuccinylase